jgi:spermidine synthase
MAAAFLFASGAAAVAYELLWARDFALLYGSTAVGTAVVLAAYFGGLALGARAGGRAASRAASLALFGRLELAVAGVVLAYLACRPLLAPAAGWLGAAVPAPFLPVVRATFAAVVLLAPTTLIGATLPAATAVLARDDLAGTGRLYAWNTLGGALGALLCGFVAIRALGVRGSFLAAAVLDVAVGAAALAWARRAATTAPPGPTEAARPGAAVALAATAGFVGLADEVLWSRGLAGVLSNSVYSVALVLAAVLIGIVLGARIGARRRGEDGRQRLAAAWVALALTSLGSLLALHVLVPMSRALAGLLGVHGPAGGLAVEAALALAVVLAPALCLGAVFTLLLSFTGGPAPATLGRLLAANTAGGIAGALAAAFVLLPGLGLGGGLLVTAALPAVAATAVAGPTWLGALAAGAGAAVATVAIAGPTLRLAWQDRYGAETLLHYADGPAATVMVTADARGAKRLRVNGQYSLGGTDGLLLERREAHLPLLLHPAPTRLLALGVGTGDTLGAAVRHPGLHADGVELLPEALGAATFFARENGGVLGDARARLVADDARSFLLGTRARWDVILSDLFLPWTAGAAALYSLDFYRLGRRHLAPGGLYCQWLPLHQLGVRDLEMIVATFAAAFPAVQLWVAYHRAATPLAALVGAETTPGADAAALAGRMADPTLAPALAAVGLTDPSDLALLYVTDGAHLRAATAGVALVTDDRPRLEFSAPAAYFHQGSLGRAALAWIAARLDPGPGPVGGAHAGAPLRAALLGAELALLAGDRPAELAAYLDALALAPEASAVRRALVAIAGERRAAGDARTATLIDARLRATESAGG